jgi:hypothetical protein
MRILRRGVVAAGLVITIAAVAATQAEAALAVRPLLLSAQTPSGAFLPQNASHTRGILVLNRVTRATFSARGHRTGLSGPGAAIFLARNQPVQAVVVIAGARPRFVPLSLNSIRYVPGFGLSAQVTVERRSRSAQLRRRFPGASAQPLVNFSRATLFASPTGVRVNDSGLPVAPKRLKNYPVDLQIHSTLPPGTVVEFEPNTSTCANSLYSKSLYASTNPQDTKVLGFSAEDTGRCFWTPSEARWYLRIIYPGKNRDYQSAWAYLTTTQVGPVYVTSCTIPKQAIHVSCKGRLTGFLDAGVDLGS